MTRLLKLSGYNQIIRRLKLENDLKNTGVLFCRCSAGIIPPEKLDRMASAVAESKAHVVELHDLCALSVDNADKLKTLVNRFQNKVIVACYPRAVENMLLQSGVPVDNLKVLNFRRQSVDSVREELMALPAEESPLRESLRSSLSVPAWFPVIEQKRCTSCGQCARFCLFGVYRFEEKKLHVENPLNCKNNCPACARSCPVSAIIFPRIKEDGVIAGAEPGEVRVDLSAPQGGPLLSRLQQRGDVRRSILRTSLIQQAEAERQKAIDEQNNQNN